MLPGSICGEDNSVIHRRQCNSRGTSVQICAEVCKSGCPKIKRVLRCIGGTDAFEEKQHHQDPGSNGEPGAPGSICNVPTCCKGLALRSVEDAPQLLETSSMRLRRWRLIDRRRRTGSGEIRRGR